MERLKRIQTRGRLQRGFINDGLPTMDFLASKKKKKMNKASEPSL